MESSRIRTYEIFTEGGRKFPVSGQICCQSDMGKTGVRPPSPPLNHLNMHELQRELLGFEIPPPSGFKQIELPYFMEK